MKRWFGSVVRVLVAVMLAEIVGMGAGGPAATAAVGQQGLMEYRVLERGRLDQPWLLLGDEALGEKFNGSLALIGATSTSEGAEFRLNLHLQAPLMERAIDLIMVDIRYDRRLFTYVRGTRLAGPAISEPGRLRILVNGGRFFRATARGEYRVSRISELYFRANAPAGTGDFTLASADFYIAGQRLVKERLHTGDSRVVINPRPSSDRSGDGLVSLGDLALARSLPAVGQQAIAAESRNTPYKRVMLIGLDGAGVSVRPEAPFFPSLSASMTQVGNRYKLPHLRRILASGAVTYSAQATLPSYSSPNWGAMLTGVEYSKHRINNRISGNLYYPEDSRYPTVFNRLREAFPSRKLASFAHWKNIGNGHVEPSAGVSVHTGNDASLIRQLRTYVEEGSAKDSSLIFLVLNGVDNAGHAHGWYTRKYYEALEKADSRVGEVEDMLRDAGLLEDTLFVLVSDHGGGTLTAERKLGRAKHHGQKGELATTTFIAASGRTVANGSGAAGSVEEEHTDNAVKLGDEGSVGNGAEHGAGGSASSGAEHSAGRSVSSGAEHQVGVNIATGGAPQGHSKNDGGEEATSLQGKLLTGGHTRDVAAIILYALGLPVDIGDAQLLPGMFMINADSTSTPPANSGAKPTTVENRNALRQVTSDRAGIAHGDSRPGHSGNVGTERDASNHVSSRQTAAVVSLRAKSDAPIAAKPQPNASAVYTLSTGNLPSQTVAMELTVTGIAAEQLQVSPLQSGLQVFTIPVPGMKGKVRLMLTHKDQLRPNEPLVELSVGTGTTSLTAGKLITEAWTADAKGHETLVKVELQEQH